jgi:hypothetical protein
MRVESSSAVAVDEGGDMPKALDIDGNTTPIALRTGRGTEWKASTWSSQRCRAAIAESGRNVRTVFMVQGRSLNEEPRLTVNLCKVMISRSKSVEKDLASDDW